MRHAVTVLLLSCAASAFHPGAHAQALTPEKVNAADIVSTVGPKSRGAAVLRAQVLLARAYFSVGEIDGGYGSNMRRAISGYQAKMGLEPTGTVNRKTWEALNATPAPALTTYVLLDADVAGPFEPIPESMADKAKLATLGFTSAVEALAEKFHMSPSLLKRLNPGKDFTLAGEEIVVANVLDTEPLPKAGKIVVDKSDHTLTLLDASGQVIAQFPSSTGSEKDPLPIGSFKVKHITANPAFFYNPKLFWDADPADTKSKIAPGPNNPVGVAWIDLSKDHYGIHGTPEPSAVGKSQSHGCIRLTNWDVAALVKSVPAGIEVILQE
ncbi:MAG TPA: L,D-transpeptidase [Telluria sp.]|nr:L,D-transpeptidase [Telluria sp.]